MTPHSKDKLLECYKDIKHLKGKNIFLGVFDEFYKSYPKNKEEQTILASYFDYGHENVNLKKSTRFVLKTKFEDFFEYKRFSRLSNYLNHVKTKKLEYKFACLDLKSPTETLEALNFFWEHMCYGGVIFVRNFNPNTIIFDQVNSFIEDKKYITSSRPMIVNGVREQYTCLKILNPKKYHTSIKIPKNNKPINICCVLNKSPEFNEHSVNNLISNIKENITVDHKIYCLTNHTEGLNKHNIDKIIPLKYKLKKWWAKMELFRDDIFNVEDQILYFDLDTIILDNIDDIASYKGKFAGLRDFYHMFKLASGVMSWNAGYGFQIFEKFMKNDKKIMRNYLEGDQHFIREQIKEHDYLQDLFPKKIISFKKDMKEKNKDVPPDGTSVVCFHGKLKILDCKNEFLLNRYKTI